MTSRYEIRLSGAGGQGLVLAGVILGEAACLYDGKNAVQSQSYGPEARGGASKSEVIISDEAIDYPKATAIDVLLALNQESCDKYCRDIKAGGTVIVDTSFVRRPPSGDFRLYPLPIIERTREEIGKLFVANIVSIGALVGLTGVISRDSLEKAVLARVPKGTEEINKKALALGYCLAAESREQK